MSKYERGDKGYLSNYKKTNIHFLRNLNRYTSYQLTCFPEQFEENIRGGCHLNDKKNLEGLFNYVTKILNCILFCHALLKTRAETSLKNKEVVG